MTETILIVDDDPDILQFVRVNLELEGFTVTTAGDGREALDKVLASPPNLVLLDIMMPRMDGLTALRRLRSHPAASNTSVILLTARGLPEDRVRGLELGADDYITKPFDVSELVARVKAVLRRTQALRDVSPLTGLPGNFKISTEIEMRIKSGEHFALVHADLDNFKAFNDHYGFMRGDQLIRFSARSLLEAAAEVDPDAFVGHVGGDDFVAVLRASVAEDFCKAVIRILDDGVLEYYDTVDALRGYIEVIDRRGERHAFPVVSISMGVVTNVIRPISSQWEASAVAVEMKEFAKKRPGSSYEIDRRLN
jgi:diguanylate cyclase (GGDEF)-like protein